MLAVTLRGIAAHKLRLLLSATAVALGIAFLAGTMVLTHTIRSSVDDLQDTLSGGSDVSVRAHSETGGDVADRAPVPAAVLDEVRRVPGVASATGSSVGFAQVVDGKGSVVGGATSVGVSLPPDGLLQVREGRAPSGPDEIAMDVDSAERAKLPLGAQVTVLLAGPARQAALVGLVAYGEITAVPGSTLVAFDPESANALLGAPGHFTTIEVSAGNGVDAEQLRADIAAALPAGLEAVSGRQAADESVKAVRKATEFLPMALMAFVAVSLFVSAFLIVNTFSMLVSQRSRELGLLRAVGATSRQVFRSVLVEALAVGALASLAGFGLGVAAANGLYWLLPTLGIELPDTPLQIDLRTAVVSLLTGTTLTVLAALLPAARAGRVPPIVAILGLTTSSARVPRIRPALGAVATVSGLGLATAGVTAGPEGGLPRLGLGALLTFVGLALLARHAVRPMVAVLGRPWAPLLGVPGRLGCDHATRNPQRTVMTSAALTIGLALVVLTSVFSASAKASLGRALDEGQRSDYIVATDQYGEYSAEITAALAQRPEFDTVAGLRFGQVNVAGGKADVTAADPAELDKVVDLGIRAGSVAALSAGQSVLVHRDVATANGWSVGQVIPMTFARAGEQQVRVAGTFEEKRLLGTDYIIGLADHDEWFAHPLDVVTLVRLADGVSSKDAEAAFSTALADHPDLQARTKDESKAEQSKQLDQVLALVTGMLGLALVIALLGIVNTLALSVHERTREVGLLRAVGMSRRQLRRTIRYEAVLIALVGAALGVAVGLAGATALVHLLREKGLTDLSVPVGQLGAYVAAAVAAGVVAAAWPAR